MPHISRKKLKKKICQKIEDQFIDFILQLKSFQEAKYFLTDILTKTERLMLVKRLTIICMLMRGYSFEAIQKILEVSPSTIGRLWKVIRNYPNSFPLIRSRVALAKSKERFWKMFYDLFTGIHPGGKQWSIMRKVFGKTKTNK